MAQAFPVLLVIRNSGGEVRRMEVRDWLKRASDNGKKAVKQDRLRARAVRRDERAAVAGEDSLRPKDATAAPPSGRAALGWRRFCDEPGL